MTTLSLKRNYHKPASAWRKQANQQANRIKADIIGRTIKRRHTGIIVNYRYLALIANDDGKFKVTDFADKSVYLKAQSAMSIMRAYKYRTSKQRLKAMNKLEKYRKSLTRLRSFRQRIFN